jgi:hypothetical protein
MQRHDEEPDALDPGRFSVLDALRRLPSSLAASRLHAPNKGIECIGFIPPRIARGVSRVYLGGNLLQTTDGMEQFPELRALSLSHNPVRFE